MIEYKNGDITESNAKYIVHQCNCITNTWSGVAKCIFEKFDWANTYKETSEYFSKRLTGRNHILGDGDSKRYVINMYGQKYPGSPTHYETAEQREKWFQECLFEIEKMGSEVVSIAFPDHIGCGLAGGNWESYLKMIEQLDDNWKKNGIENLIVIIKKES